MAIPNESGSLHGFRILKLETPGRYAQKLAVVISFTLTRLVTSLARLTVEEGDNHVVRVSPRNVAAFSIDRRYVNLEGEQIYVDGAPLELGIAKDVHVVSQGVGVWRVSTIICPALKVTYNSFKVDQHSLDDISPPAGRASKILSSSGPFTLVVPHRSIDSAQPAIRMAHDLDVYHKLDAEIIDSSEAIDRLDKGALGQGNIVTIGGVNNNFTCQLLEKGATPFSLSSEGLLLHGRPISQDTASLFLQPHPTFKSSLVLVMHANEEQGLERLLRLFPLRTGISIPDWVLLGRSADAFGAGGIEGAGYVLSRN